MRAQSDPRSERSSQKRSHDEIVQGRKAHLIELVGKRLGESLNWENLGPMAKVFLDTVAGPQMKKALQSETKAVPAGLAKRMTDDLQDLVGKDRFLLAPPSDAKDRPSVLDGRQMQVVPNRGSDTHSMAGTIDLGAHVLGDVFKTFDIRADGLTGTVADALKVGLEGRADLANPRTWLNIVPQMAAAAMATKGPWQARVGAAAVAGISGLANQPEVIEAKVVSSPAATERDGVERTSKRQQANLLGSGGGSRVTSDRSSKPRAPGTMAGGILGLAQARVESGDNRKLASQTRELMKALRDVMGDDAGEIDDLSKLVSSVMAKGVGGQPRLIDASGAPAPQNIAYPNVDPKVAEFADAALGPEGLNVEVVGGNEVAAANFLGILGMATNVTEKELGRPIDLSDPQDQAAVLRIAIDNLIEVSPTARALSSAFEALSTTPDAEAIATFRDQMGRHQRSMATTWVVEALTTKEPDALKTAQKSVSTALEGVQAAIDESGETPELANARTTLNAQLRALQEPDDLLAQAVLRGGLGELQYSESDAGMDATAWSRLARGTFEKATLDAQRRLDAGLAGQAVAPEAAAALGRSSLAAIWNVAAEAAGGVPLAGGGGIGGPPGGGGIGGPPGSDGMPPFDPGNGGPGRPGDMSNFDLADSYTASLGGRVDKRQAIEEGRQSFDDIRAILNDPSIEFFDKIFLVMTMLIDRMRDKVEKDQIDQLDREEMMWINEQLAHEYQKEVEMAQRDIHELGKKVEDSAERFAKAEHHLDQLERDSLNVELGGEHETEVEMAQRDVQELAKSVDHSTERLAKAEQRLERLEATPDAERAPDHDQQVLDAKQDVGDAHKQWSQDSERLQTANSVLSEVGDARERHGTMTLSARLSLQLFRTSTSFDSDHPFSQGAHRGELIDSMVGQAPGEDQGTLDEQVARALDRGVTDLEREVGTAEKVFKTFQDDLKQAESKVEALTAKPEHAQDVDHGQQLADAKQAVEQARYGISESRKRHTEKTGLLDGVRKARDSHTARAGQTDEVGGAESTDPVHEARNEFAAAKAEWVDNVGRFEKRKTVLNELRDARDAHRVQIASDRRSADIFAAKVKRNTHVVEMYMDLIKTFEDHKQRNLARMLQ